MQRFWENPLTDGQHSFLRTCLLRTGPKVTKVINTIAALVDWHIPDRGRSRAAAISKMARFLIIVNGWEPLTIIAKRSILDVASALDPPLPDIQTSEKKLQLCGEKKFNLLIMDKLRNSFEDGYVYWNWTFSFSPF